MGGEIKGPQLNISKKIGTMELHSIRQHKRNFDKIMVDNMRLTIINMRKSKFEKSTRAHEFFIKQLCLRGIINYPFCMTRTDSKGCFYRIAE